jgi:hypothetical protein
MELEKVYASKEGTELVVQPPKARMVGWLEVSTRGRIRVTYYDSSMGGFGWLSDRQIRVLNSDRIPHGGSGLR